jgi:hypothetical protein
MFSVYNLVNFEDYKLKNQFNMNVRCWLHTEKEHRLRALAERNIWTYEGESGGRLQDEVHNLNTSPNVTRAKKSLDGQGT